jgi:hypothetical protein
VFLLFAASLYLNPGVPSLCRFSLSEPSGYDFERLRQLHGVSIDLRVVAMYRRPVDAVFSVMRRGYMDCETEINAYVRMYVHMSPKHVAQACRPPSPFLPSFRCEGVLHSCFPSPFSLRPPFHVAVFQDGCIVL